MRTVGTLIWHLDKWNHLLLRRFRSKRLCDLNERLIWGRLADLADVSSEWAEATFDACASDLLAQETTCHCGKPVTYGYDGDPTHHRGMCEECDLVRCDAYPGECKR